MADNSLLIPLTDPRMMLAQQLLQNSTDASPLRSGWQEAARAVQPILGALLMKQGQQNQMAALNEIYNPSGTSGPNGSGQPQAQQSPDLLQRIGNFFTGAGSSTDANNTVSPSAAAATSGAPQGADKSTTTSASTSGTPSPGAGSPSASMGPVSGNPSFSGPFARQTWQAYRMIQVGQQRGIPAYVSQGMQLLQNIQQEQAKASAEAVKDGKSIAWNPDGSVSVSGVNGYDQTVANTDAAKTRATELAKLDPSITQGKIGQTNAINVGTMGTEAAKSGAIAGANAAATKSVELKMQPAIDYATTSAINQANAGRPLTPIERNDQEQKIAEQFRNSEPVKDYIQTAQGYRNVLSAAQGTDKASDINLIDGLVKMFNPGATVRQATFETFMEHSQGIPDNVKGMVKGWFDNDQHLQPDTRAQLLAQAQNRMEASRTTYRQLSDSIAQQSHSQGLSPKNILPNVIDPLTAREELARRRAAAAANAAPSWAQKTAVSPDGHAIYFNGAGWVDAGGNSVK